MVIQNNIPGLNSKRLYNKNSSRLAKSLEKLSSGYSINRAADGAAGLAVSEKMRSQIFGMQQSVKNCQDGISLIQTFEGALGETAAIIKRMKSLADQSANGTYDDNVDRNAMEVEYLHLCDEVNHIAETDFNGVVMLNGKQDGTVSAAELERTVNERLNSVSSVSSYLDIPQTVSVQAAAFAAPKAGGTACGDFTVYGNSSDFSFDTTSGVLTILGGNVTVEGTGAPTTNTIVVAKDKSANVTLRNVNIDTSGCAFKIEDDSKGDVTVTLEGDNTLKSSDGAGLQKNGDINCGTLIINGSGKLMAVGDGLSAGIGGSNPTIGDYFHINTSNIIIVSGTIIAESKSEGTRSYGAGIGGCSYGNAANITILGGNITARSEYGSGIGGGNSVRSVIPGEYTMGGEANGIYIYGGVINATSYGPGSSGAGIGGDAYTSDIVIHGGEIIANGGVTGVGIGGGGVFGKTNITINGGKITAVGDCGAGIGTRAGTYNTAIEILINGGEIVATSHRNGAGIGSGGKNDGNVNIIIKNKETVVMAKGGTNADDIGSGLNCNKNPIVNIDSILAKEPYSGNGIIDGTIVHYKGNTNNPNPDKPNAPDSSNTPNIPNDKLTVSTRPSKGEAKLTCTDNLILQTGARTKDSVNFTFAYSSDGIGGLAADLNCTAKGLGMDTLTLKTQESANYAIDKLDHALNKVSMIRATFGAAQNRLEHKIDNLNNTTENLTAAESIIRDTDMAKEMMNFTKNQILTQSSQSMLAQANSLPQQVMSLIGA